MSDLRGSEPPAVPGAALPVPKAVPPEGPRGRDAAGHARNEAETIAGSTPALVSPEHEATQAGPASAASSGAQSSPGSPPRSFGAFQLLECLGAGGMGEVWKAYDSDLQRVVALKLIRAELSRNAEALSRFQREARLAARLRHPGIVGIYHVGQHADQHYIAMEFVEGHTLADELDPPGPSASPGPATRNRMRHGIDLLATVAEAVDHAHRLGIVHRDLKPANILIDREGRPFVTDFGLAKEVAEQSSDSARLTRSGQVLGTPSYMAPEQVDGAGALLAPSCDVWALGVMLHEILTGRLPFEGEGSMRVLHLILSQEVAPLRRGCPWVPVELEAVCLKTLEKDSRRRYPTAGKFALELRRWLRGEPVEARPQGPGYRMWRWAARRWRVTVPASLAALLLVGALAWAGHERRSGRERTEAVLRAALGEVADSVRRFENALHRFPLDAEARELLAAQPLGLATRMAESVPGFGPALAWRGHVEGLLGQDAAADEDLRRACESSPACAVVWYLQGERLIRRYARLRGIPQVGFTTWLTTRVTLDMPPESDGDRALREQGLASLARIASATEPLGDLEGEDARIARAMAAVFADRPEGLAEAVRDLESSSSPKARWLRGRALYCLRRFAEAIPPLEAAEQAWPEHREVRHLLAGALHAAGVELLAGPTDPMPMLERARAAYAAIRDRFPAEKGSFEMPAIMVEITCAEATEARGRDPDPFYSAAIARMDQVIERHPRAVALRKDRGFWHLRIAQSRERRGLDPTDAYRRSVEDYRAVTGSSAANNDLANGAVALLALARLAQGRGEDAEPWMKEAETMVERALAATPGHAPSNLTAAQAMAMRGTAAASRGEDPRPLWRRAADHMTRAVDGWPENGRLYLQLVRALRRLAAAELGRGGDANGVFERLEAVVRRALERDSPGAELELAQHLRLVRRQDALAELERSLAGKPAADRFRRWKDAVHGEVPCQEGVLELALGLECVTDLDYVATRGLVERGLPLVQSGGLLPSPEDVARLSLDPAGATALAQSHYNLACALALAANGRAGPAAEPAAVPGEEARLLRDRAFAHLAGASKFGFRDAEHARVDLDLAGLHGDARWQRWLDSLAN